MTEHGRVTLSGRRTEHVLTDDTYRTLLRTSFGIELDEIDS